MTNKKCIICGKIFSQRYREGFRDWNNRKFCSQSCYHKYQSLHPNQGTFKSGNHPKSEFKKGHPKPVNAYVFPSGKNHYNWKGNNIKYAGLHMWVYDNLGKYPPICKFCGKAGKKNGRNWSIQWANKSGKYLRKTNDWIALCISCHKKYDINRQ